MKHETANSIRPHRSSGKNSTDKIASASDPVHSTVPKTQNSSRSAGRQKTGGAGRQVTDAVLTFSKVQFIPKLLRNNDDDKLTARQQRELQRSLCHLATHYGIKHLNTEGVPYPQNLTLAITDAEHQIQAKGIDISQIKIRKTGQKAFLITTEHCIDCSTLYYIPVIPLYNILKGAKTRQAGKLLQFAFAYLLKIGVPYYRNDGTELYATYEMLEEMMQEDESEIPPSEMSQAFTIGDIVLKKISNPETLKNIGSLIDNFHCKSPFDHACLKIAADAYSIYKQYPHESIFRNEAVADHEGEWEFEYLVTMDKYTAFCADISGSLSYQIDQFQNDDLTQADAITEPLLTKEFNGDALSGNLDFEKRVYDLIIDLCSFLATYKKYHHEKHHHQHG